jgi:uncharacterized membrane protein/nitrite reductase/ring-hydroxylating ferredoxin subunit
MFKALLQGKPFGHPLHPALVHFPIGLFFLSLGLDIASYLSNASSNLFQASLYVMGLGIVGGILAVMAGLADRSDIRSGHPARKTVNLHMVLNLSALGLFVLNLFLRLRQFDLAVTPIYLLLSAVGVGMILFSGYLGGTMVYDDGVGVGRHRRYTRLPRETIRVRGQADRDGWVPVCNESGLGDGETLRVDYDDNIIVIARQGEEVYAFQEFCTHRYGPLSEGRVQDHRVVCPWHRSCFDMRTGKVVEGPAKVDLKTYAATIRAGKILIK